MSDTAEKQKKSKKERSSSSKKEDPGPSTAEKSSSKKKKRQQEAEEAAAEAVAAPSTDKKQKKKKEKQQEQPAADSLQQQQQPSSKKARKSEAAAADGGQPVSDKKRKKQEQEQQQQQSSKKHKKQQQQGKSEAAAAEEHVTVTIQVPAATAAGSSKKTKAQQQQEQQQVAGAGPWLVYMAAPDPSVHSKLQFKAYVPQGAAAAADKGLLLVSEQEGTTLIGSTNSNINEPAAQFGGYAVGVYDKQANTLQLAKPAGGTVVRVEALASQAGPVQLAALSKPAQQSMEQQQAAKAARQGPQDAAARRAQAARLVAQFGSTRRKRQLQQRADATVVVSQNAAAAELDVMMEEVQRRAAAAGDTRQEIMGRLAANRVIPVHNPLATTPQEAYQARLMFGEALLSAVNMAQILHAVENADDAEKLKTKVPAYVIHRLARVREAGSNQAERKRRARLLALLAALIRLASARPKLTVRPAQPAVEAEGEGEGRQARAGGLEGLAASLRIGRQQVLELLLDKFYDKRMEDGRLVYVREAKQEQLLLMHLLVVALDLEGWRMAPQQFELLRRELKSTATDVVTRFRELGCSSSAVRIQVPAEAGGEATTSTSYNITLLPSTDKTLAQSFPKPKVLKKAGPR